MARTRLWRTAVDPVSQSWALVTSAGVIRLGLGFVASLVIARALGAADFGTYAIIAASVGIVSGLAEGGLTEAAVLRISATRNTSPRLSADRALAFFWLRLTVAAAIAVLGCLLAVPIVDRWLPSANPDLLRWALVGIVATAASGAVSAILQAAHAFARMSSLTLFNTGLTAALAIPLAASGQLNLLTALVVLGIGTSLATFALACAALPPPFMVRWPSGHLLTREAKSLFRTGRWLWLASVFAMFTANAEVLLLNGRVALPLVGAYALALGLASRADLVNHSLYTVLLPRVAAIRQPEAMQRYLRLALIRGGLIAVGLALLVPVAPWLITFFYGPAYAPAVIFFQWLVGVMILDLLLTPVLLLPLTYGQPRLLAAGDATRAVVLVGVGLVLIPAIGPFGAIAARFASRVLGAIVVLSGLWLDRAALQVQHEESAGVAHQRPVT